MGSLSGLALDSHDEGPDGVTVMDWPATVLPTSLSAYATEVAASVGCPVDYVGVAMLTVAAAALGGAVTVRLRDGWTEAPTIWTAVVAPPGSAKTPAIQEIMRPVRAAEDLAWAEWDGAHRGWLRDVRTHERAARRAKEDPGDPPDEPTMQRLVTDDATTEALTPLLAANPRGLLLCRDELVGWLRAMDAYHAGRGADRQWWLSVWSGVPASKDRVATGYVRAPHPYVSVLGGIVPVRLPDVAGDGGDDGMADRMLFCYPDAIPPAPWTPIGIGADGRKHWATAWAALRRYGMEPVEVTWTAEGGRVWAQSYDAHIQETTGPASPSALRGPAAKMRAYAARVALVIQALDDAAAGRPLRHIEADAVGRAWVMIDYHLNHARRVYLHLAVTPTEVEGADADVLAMAKVAGADGVTSAQVAGAMNTSPRTARRVLSRLVAAGTLQAVGAPQATDRKYRVPSPP